MGIGSVRRLSGAVSLAILLLFVGFRRAPGQEATDVEDPLASELHLLRVADPSEDARFLVPLARELLAGGHAGAAVLSAEAARREAGLDPAIVDLLAGCRAAAGPDLASYESIDDVFEEPETIIAPGARWRFLRGTREPSAGTEWTSVAFDDRAWEEGPSGFGYGDDDDATLLDDMRGTYSSLYVRRSFSIDDPARVRDVVLTVLADDGFVAYLNGQEIGRELAGERGDRMAHDALASASAPEPIPRLEIPLAPEILRPGRNVIALRGLNVSLDSSDFSLIPSLGARVKRVDRRQFESFLRLPVEGAVAGRRSYLEGRLFQEAGDHAAAVERFQKAVSADDLDPLGHRRLAECLLALGKAEAVEASLREALRAGHDDRDLWDLWFETSLRHLRRTWKDLTPFPGWPHTKRGRAFGLHWALNELATIGAIRINCGGEDYVSLRGITWHADRFYSTGSAFYGGATLFEGEIKNTQDPGIYRSERFFSPSTSNRPHYSIPVFPGAYRVRLHFAEIVYESGVRRVFDTFLEGKKVLDAYEPRAAGFATADVRTFEVTVEDAFLDIRFAHRMENPKLSAIEVERFEPLEKDVEQPPEVRGTRPEPSPEIQQATELASRCCTLVLQGAWIEATPLLEDLKNVLDKAVGERDPRTTQLRRMVRVFRSIVELPPEGIQRLAADYASRRRDSVLQAVSSDEATGAYEEAVAALSQLLTAHNATGGGMPSELRVILELPILYGELGLKQRRRLAAKSALEIAKRCLERPPAAAFFEAEVATSLVELDRRSRELVKSRSFPEALAAAEEALGLSERRLGVDHWRSKEARNEVDTLRKLLAASLPLREGVARAYEIIDEGNALADQGRHEEQLSLMEEVLTTFLDAFGEESTWTASAYNNLGSNFLELERQEEARPWLEKGCSTARRTFGEDHPDTGTCCGNLATALSDLGRFKEAQVAQEDALKAFESALGLEDERTESAYHRLGHILSLQGLHRQALPVRERALAISQKLHGASDPETMHCLHDLAITFHELGMFREAIAALEHRLKVDRSLEKNADGLWSVHNNLGAAFNACGEYARGKSHLEKALEKCIELNGENHPEIGRLYSQLGLCLKEQGLYREAREHYERALKLLRGAPGYEDPLITALHNLGVLALEVEDLAEADSLSREALTLARKLHGEGHFELATLYISRGSVLFGRGRLAEAKALLDRTLAILLKTVGEDHPVAATAYESISRVLDQQGKEVEAWAMQDRAVAILEKLYDPSHPRLIHAHANLAVDLQQRGRSQEGIDLAASALLRLRQVHGPGYRQTILATMNLGAMLARAGRAAEAESRLHEALGAAREHLGEGHPLTASILQQLAERIERRGGDDQAESLLEAAVNIRQAALGREHPETVEAATALADCLRLQGKLPRAAAVLEEAAAGFEHARLRVARRGLDRSVASSKLSPLPALAVTLARLGRHAEAWERWEQDLGRGLLDDVSAREARRLSDEDRHREDDLVQEAAILERETQAALEQGETLERKTRLEELERRRFDLAARIAELDEHLKATYGVAAGKTYSLEEIARSISADTALVGWLDVAGVLAPQRRGDEHWAVVLRSKGDPIWVEIPPLDPATGWSREDDLLPVELASSLAQRDAAGLDGRIQKLAVQRLGPLERHLSAREGLPEVRHLVVLPSPGLAEVPVQLLSGRRTVSHAPSATLHAWIERKKQGRGTPGKPLEALLVGDPIAAGKLEGPFPNAGQGVLVTAVENGGSADRAGIKAGDVLLSYAGEAVWRSTDVAHLVQKSAAGGQSPVSIWRNGPRELLVDAGPLGATVADRSPEEKLLSDAEFLKLLEMKELGPLPGSRREVEAIAAVLEARGFDVERLLDVDAGEDRIQELAESGALSSYRFIHLATHAAAMTDRAFDSALFLPMMSMDPPSSLDGRLTAGEILRDWTIDAEVVVLSACQSALGRRAGGEGHLGFSQALLLAGARSLLLSLWKVDDAATELLMRRFYENLLGARADLPAPLRKAEALQEAQAWIRRLDSPRVAVLRAAIQRGTGAVVLEPGLDTAERPFSSPYYWAAFILIGSPD